MEATSCTVATVPPAEPSWALYMALEPYVRRRWPQSMVTWSRVLRGGFRDPLVGGHLLVGVALGIGLALLNAGIHLARWHVGTISANTAILEVLDARGLAGSLLDFLIGGFLFGMLLTFVLMLLRV